MTNAFKALVARKENGRTCCAFETQDEEFLDPGSVTVAVEYSTPGCFAPQPRCQSLV